MGVWQRVVMNFLKFYLGPPCPTILCPVGGPPLKRQFQEWPALAGGLRPSSFTLRHPTPYTYVEAFVVDACFSHMILSHEFRHTRKAIRDSELFV